MNILFPLEIPIFNLIKFSQITVESHLNHKWVLDWLLVYRTLLDITGGYTVKFPITSTSVQQSCLDCRWLVAAFKGGRCLFFSVPGFSCQLLTATAHSDWTTAVLWPPLTHFRSAGSRPQHQNLITAKQLWDFLCGASTLTRIWVNNS